MSNVALQKPLNSAMVISKSGIEHISKDEGFSATPYNDMQVIAPWGWVLSTSC
jgi:GH24 family phage-related lysozyme (muramidase)